MFPRRWAVSAWTKGQVKSLSQVQGKSSEPMPPLIPKCIAPGAYVPAAQPAAIKSEKGAPSRIRRMVYDFPERGAVAE